MMTRESLAFWFANVSFGATGVLMVLILQWEDYQGIGNREAAITLLANFLGQAIVCSPALFIEQSPRRRYRSLIPTPAAPRANSNPATTVMCFGGLR